MSTENDGTPDVPRVPWLAKESRRRFADSVDAMAYTMAHTMAERSREFHMNAPRAAATVSLTVGCTTSTFDVQRNYDGWAMSDVLADMAQMLRVKESAESSQRATTERLHQGRVEEWQREYMGVPPSQGPTRDDLVEIAQELAAKYPKPSSYARRRELRGLGRGMTCQPRYTYGKHVSEWESLLPPACEHCGGQPQRWDSDARCMVSGGECEHCGAGKDEHGGR